MINKNYCKTNFNWIFSEIDGPFDFNEILVNRGVLNVVSMDNISFFAEMII